ncbi:MAG TPA: valine--tRNA ligase, partial [Blastocatellia bacterium]|nr:valine--tRNA ligase [Blastocatellia bacterium]
YRGTRIVNWCPRDKTVLSDLEVKEEKARDGKLYYLRYPVIDAVGNRQIDAGGGDGSNLPHITVATTRPETMLGDTAVAVNPADKRYSGLIGKFVDLPLTGRKIPIIADEYVESDFGTG